MRIYGPPRGREGCKTRRRLVRAMTTDTRSVCPSRWEPIRRKVVPAFRCGGPPSISQPRLCEAWWLVSRRRNVRRANRFRRQHDRGRFIAARGWLRHLLASELRCAPSDITIITDDGGKPRLASSDLSFNASRTASIALYATSRSMEVGVDIEAIRAMTDIDRMAARFLSQAEQRRLALLSPAQRESAFFQCWTRKEALLKGIGTGLSFPLREVDVWDGDGRPATVSGWSVHQVDLAPGFAAAVAGASLDDWVPPVPRRLRALSPEIRTDDRQAVAPAAQVASGR